MVLATGARVTVACNGQEALDAVRREGFDLVLMDLQMPVMNGMEATRAIRALGEAGNMPIVAMTASATAGDRDRCLAAGMNDHLVKPVDPESFQHTIERWIPPVALRKARRRSSSSQLSAVKLPFTLPPMSPEALIALHTLLQSGHYGAVASVAHSGRALDDRLGDRTAPFHAAIGRFDFERASTLLEEATATMGLFKEI